MGAMASQITSLNIVYLTVYSAQIKENIKVPCHWPLCGAFTGDRWIPRTNGQKHGKRFHFNDVFMHQRSPNDACCASGEELLTTNSIKPQLHSCDSSHSRDKMAAILADDIFKWIFLNDNDRFKFYWNLFLGVQLTINDPGNALAPNRWQAIIWTKLTRILDAYMRHQGGGVGIGVGVGWLGWVGWQAIIWTKMTRFLDAYMRHQGWGWGLGWGLVDWGGWGGVGVGVGVLGWVLIFLNSLKIHNSHTLHNCANCAELNWTSTD